MGETIKRCPACICEGNGTLGYDCARSLEQGEFNKKHKVLVVGNRGQGAEGTMFAVNKELGGNYHLSLLNSDGLQNGSRERVLRRLKESRVVFPEGMVLFLVGDEGIDSDLFELVADGAAIVAQKVGEDECVSQYWQGKEVGSFVYSANGSWNVKTMKIAVEQMRTYAKDMRRAAKQGLMTSPGSGAGGV